MYSVCLNELYAVSGSGDDTIQVFNLTTMKAVKRLKFSNAVYYVSFGPINTWLANKIISCSYDRTLRIWNVENEKIEHEFKHDKYCRSFDIDQNGETLVVAYGYGSNGGVSVWSIRDHKQMTNIKTDSGAMDVRFNKFDKQIVAGCYSGELYKITL